MLAFGTDVVVVVSSLTRIQHLASVVVGQAPKNWSGKSASGEKDDDTSWRMFFCMGCGVPGIASTYT